MGWTLRWIGVLIVCAVLVLLGVGTDHVEMGVISAGLITLREIVRTRTRC